MSDFQSLINGLNEKIADAEAKISEAQDVLNQRVAQFNSEKANMQAHINYINGNLNGSLQWKNSAPWFSGGFGNFSVSAAQSVRGTSAQLDTRNAQKQAAETNLTEVEAEWQPKIAKWQADIDLLTQSFSAGISQGASPEAAAQHAENALKANEQAEFMKSIIKWGLIGTGGIVAVLALLYGYKTVSRKGKK